MNDRQMTHDDDLGEVAYIAYGDYVDWKNVRDEPMPDWADLPAKIQRAWRVAATRVALLRDGIVIVTEAAEAPTQPTERTYDAASWTVTDGDLHITADDGSPVATYQRHCWYAIRRADATA